MTDTIIKIVAFALLAAYIGVIGVWVPHVDLLAVIGFTIAMAGYDFFWSGKKKKG